MQYHEIVLHPSYILGPEGLDLPGFFKITDISEQAEVEQTTVPVILEKAE